MFPKGSQKESKSTLKRIWDIGMWGVTIVLLVVVYRKYFPGVDVTPQGEAPPFALVTLEGDTLRHTDAPAQIRVINLWATWCPPCRVEMPGFVDLQEEFAGEVQFIGWSLDDEESRSFVETFAAERGINFPITMGSNLVLGEYPAAVLPTTYVLDAQNQIRFQHEGLLLKQALRPVLRALVSEMERDS